MDRSFQMGKHDVKILVSHVHTYQKVTLVDKELNNQVGRMNCFVNSQLLFFSHPYNYPKVAEMDAIIAFRHGYPLTKASMTTATVSGSSTSSKTNTEVQICHLFQCDRPGIWLQVDTLDHFLCGKDNALLLFEQIFIWVMALPFLHVVISQNSHLWTYRMP